MSLVTIPASHALGLVWRVLALAGGTPPPSAALPTERRIFADYRLDFARDVGMMPDGRYRRELHGWTGREADDAGFQVPPCLEDRLFGQRGVECYCWTEEMIAERRNTDGTTYRIG